MEEFFLSTKEDLGKFVLSLNAKDVHVSIVDQNFLVQKGGQIMAVDEKILQEYTSKTVEFINDLSSKQAGLVKEAIKQEIKQNAISIAELQKMLEANKVAIKSAADEIASLKAMLGEDGQKLQKIINIFKQLAV